MLRNQMLSCLAGRILSIQIHHPLRVAIDGIDAAGKTCLAEELAIHLRGTGREVIQASSDNFHLPREIRYQKGEESPEGYYYDSFDYEAILASLLVPLGPAGNRFCRIRTYDFQHDKAMEDPFIQVAEDAILLFDGVFLLRPNLNSYWDFRIFVNVDFETSLRRAQDRDITLFGSKENVKRRYLQRYLPAQSIYLQEVNPQNLANVIVDNTKPHNPTFTHLPINNL